MQQADARCHRSLLDRREIAWKLAPEEYAAIHFHDDDLSDAGWEPSFSWTVPDDLPKRRLCACTSSSGDDEDYIPFFVVPPLGKPTAKIAILIPTFSYLAYGNEQMLGPTGVFSGDGCRATRRQPQDKYIVETGLRSLYDRHTDGTGVCYSSWMRPIVNMRPKYDMPFLDFGKGSPHQFNADLHLIDWLEEQGIEYDVITDLELHHDGLGAAQGLPRGVDRDAQRVLVRGDDRRRRRSTWTAGAG